MFELTPYFRTRHNRAMNVYNPFRELDELERAFFGSAFQTAPRSFNTDITDNGDKYTVMTDLPGFRKEDIQIDITEDTLTVKAERHSDYEDKDKKNSYIRVERSYGSYSRSFDISGIKADDISAKYENGVLTLVLPKKEEPKPSSRRLEIA